MSIASAQYDKFKEEVASQERAYTFSEDGELLVYRARTGDTVPFWSSRSRLEKIQKRLPKYRAYSITELSLSEFYSRLAQLERESILVGVNWSGARLGGYNLPVHELREGLAYYLNKNGKRLPP